MQASASVVTDHFGEILRRLPGDLDLDRLALESKALSRRRGVPNAAALLHLALVRGPGGMSLRQTAAWACVQNVAELSNPSLKERLDNACGFLAAVVDRLLVAKTGGPSLHWPGRLLRVADGTSISEPGSSGTDWRVHGVFDLGGGGFAHLELTDGRAAETITRGAALPGEIRIGDRGFAKAPALSQLRHDSAGAADFIVRLPWNGFRFRDADNKPLKLIEYLQKLPADPGPHEVVVQAVLRQRGAAPLPMRLIILRKPPDAAAKACKKLLRKASKNQRALDPGSLIAAEFLVLGSSLPAEDYPAHEVLSAYRLRWQIELAFKRLKSLLRIDQLPTHSERGSRSWLYAHLILALLCDEISQEILESFP